MQKRMPFSLTGAPTMFGHVTVDKLGDLLSKLNIELLVDDGGMAGDCFEDLLDHTRQFFIHVQESCLSLSAKKSVFFITKIIFAGSLIGPNGVKPDTTKITVVVDWCQPPDVLNLSRFLGLTGHFRDLVKGYTKIAQPLTDLVHSVNVPKNAGKATYRAALQAVKLTNSWTKTHAKAFLALKMVLALAECWHRNSPRPDLAAKPFRNHIPSHLPLNEPPWLKHGINCLCWSLPHSNTPSTSSMSSYGASLSRSTQIVKMC
jgi:hypothetical protein